MVERAAINLDEGYLGKCSENRKRFIGRTAIDDNDFVHFNGLA